MPLVASCISNDILLMVNQAERKALLFVGKEKFFASIEIIRKAYMEFDTELLWIVEENRVVQVVTPRHCETLIRSQNLMII